MYKLYKKTYKFSSQMKLKTFSVTASSNIGQNVQAYIQSKNQNLEVPSPLETLLSGVCACEINTAYFHAKRMKIKLGSIKVTKCVATYDGEQFLGGSPDQNKFKDLQMTLEIETDADQIKFDQLHDITSKSCPAINMLHLAGVEINAEWIKKNLPQ